MDKIVIKKVSILDNPNNFLTKFRFEIIFECPYPLQEGLELKVIYVIPFRFDQKNQVLTIDYVTSVTSGEYRILLQADPPDVTKIPNDDAVGAAGLSLICAYHGQEFAHIWFYISNYYSEDYLRDNPPQTPQFEKVVRNIRAAEHFISYTDINWHDPAANDPQIGLN